MSSKALHGNIFALMAVFFSSTYTIFNKVLLADFAPPTLAAISQTISVVALLIFFGAMPEWKKIHKRPFREIIAIVILGVLATVVSPLLFLKGLESTLTTNAILLGKMDVIVLAVISAIWLKEKITKQQIIGTIIMLIGLYIIVTQGAFGFDLQMGDAYILMATVTWATSTAIFKKYLHHVTPEAVVIISGIVGALTLFFLVPPILGIEHDITALGNKQVFRTLVLYSLFTVVLAQFLRFKAMDIIPASRVSTLYLLSPIVAVLLAVIFLKESLDISHLIGGIFVIAGLVFSVLHHQKHPHHHLHERIKHHGQH